MMGHLTYLAAEGRVSRLTQMQALSALLLLYRDVLGRPVSDLRRALRSTSPTRLPAVLNREEVRSLLAALRGTMRLIGFLLSGAGLRLMECLTLRVKDLDCARGEIRVWRGKGGKDRITMIPAVARTALERQVERVKVLHTSDLTEGAGRVEMPPALMRKAPGWASDRAWQWVFPSARLYQDFAPVRSVGITFTNPRCSERSSARCATRGSRSGPPIIRSGTPLRRTCWRMDTTSGRCRSY